MDPTQVNYLAVLVAALSSFLIGGLWYSPLLFARLWAREAGIAEAELGKGFARALSGSAVASLLIAVNLAFFLGVDAGAAWGATAGALAGIGWAAASLTTIHLFERRSWTLIVIDAGYLAVSYPVMGAIIGAWQ